MPPADAAAGTGDRFVVWRLGGALLAAPLERTEEVAALDADGRARPRTGPLELVVPPGLTPETPPARAIIVRTERGRVALAAEEVEGVSGGAGTRAETPGWLRRLPLRHLDALVHLDDDRIAALLAVDTFTGS